MGSRPNLDQAATGGHDPTSPPDPTAQLFDRLNPALAADHGATAHDPAGLRRVADALARGWRTTLDDHNENTGPPHWHRQHLADRVARAQLHATDPPHPTRAERAFDQLNFDYGVPADHHHRDGHRAVQQREAALALGARVTVAAMRENDRDPVIWLVGQDYRAADAIEAARHQPIRARHGAERGGGER
jgi:uncharacterized coiled-coil protein SlyX